MRLLAIVFAALLTGCAPPPPSPAAQQPKPDPVTEPWYGQTVGELAALNRDAAKSFAAGKLDNASALITKGQPLSDRLLAVTRPTLAAMQAAADLDDLYGRMLLANHSVGWARIVFQKNVARWTNWRPETPDTMRRKKDARARLAECDRLLEK